ncbi:MAG: demethylmenaquinone methyltransferase / 2-methoxy-6-polyprenyl,4-benzoquinol methylase [Actinomycetota bacterium]|nr:demethylmenaquinone methyltransferase / 2-methoxy-6-polyprenyl,4-benzoquinol methylase [Actinomycetota bacterium]
MSDDVERELRDTYSDAAASWATGPSRVYRLLADALVAYMPEVVPGARVLDLGAGTGVASDAVASTGARVIAADVAYGMLRHDSRSRPPAVCADAARLPFRTDSFDHVVAAFVLNHVPDLISALSELGRVVGPGGTIAASSFSSERPHPAKDAIGKVVDAAGFVPPDWFTTFKTEREPPSGSPDAFQHAATVAGLTRIDVHDVDVDISGVGADGLAAYRLGMAQIQPFLGSLGDHERAEVEHAAMAAAAPFLGVPMPMLALVARVQG